MQWDRNDPRSASPKPGEPGHFDHHEWLKEFALEASEIIKTGRELTAEDFGAEPAGTAAAGDEAHVRSTDPHMQYLTVSRHSKIDHSGLPGVPKLLVLGPTDPVPEGTAAGTVIVRTGA